jgi:hypothetical protein
MGLIFTLLLEFLSSVINWKVQVMVVGVGRVRVGDLPPISVRFRVGKQS